MQRTAFVLPPVQDRDTRPDLDDVDRTQTGLQAPRLSMPVLPRPRLPIPSVPPRPSLAPTEDDEPSTRLRPAATRPSLPASELVLAPAMLPPPMAGLAMQERTAILVLPPIDPTPPPDAAIRTPFAMAVPPEDRDTRLLTLAPPLQAEVLGQRLPLSRVAIIVGSTLAVAALVVVGLRPGPAPAPAGLVPPEPVTSLPAPTAPPIAPLAASGPPLLPTAASAPAPVAAAHPPARHPRGRPRLPARREP